MALIIGPSVYGTIFDLWARFINPPDNLYANQARNEFYPILQLLVQVPNHPRHSTPFGRVSPLLGRVCSTSFTHVFTMSTCSFASILHEISPHTSHY